MRPFAIALRLLAIAFIATASLHLVYGLKADAMLGAQVSAEMVHNASLDSQNRFYGITFSMLGVALFVAATDLRRYRPIVVANLAVSFAAGLARIVSWALYSSPAPMIVGLVIANLLLTPIFYVWLRKAIPSNGS